GAARAEVYLR
nr:Chain B, Histone-lysine N-methyltransferase MLL4 [Homo sapiens]